MKIYLVLDCLDYGDGVSNDVIAQQKIFRDMGYICEIYTAIYDQRMKEKRMDVDLLRCSSDDIILHHYSGFSQTLGIVKRQPCRKVMIYHNITPPEFVEGETKRHCQMGLEQVATLAGVYDAYVGDSSFNIACLQELGVTKVGDVLPIPVEFPETGAAKLTICKAGGIRFLFVGRYVPNKKLEDVIDAFAYFRRYIDPEAKLDLVGNPDVSQTYTELLHNKILLTGFEDSIQLWGKVSQQELQQLYEDADLYLCMSEHEGFCIPLLEAMWHQLPVFAYDAGAVRETMGNAGVVFRDKTPAVVAHMIKTVMRNQEILDTIIQRQNLRITDFSGERVQKRLEELLPIWLGNQTRGDQKDSICTTRKLKVQMQGPFETSYSLAQVNRFLIEALYKTGRVDASIHCREGGGDYEPKAEDLKDKPLVKYLWQREKCFGIPDVALRNMFPPVTTGLTAQFNFQAFGWEEDRVPQEYVSWFNRDLDGIGTTSEFVTEALINSGVTIPVRTMGNGVRLPSNYEDLPAYRLQTKKNVRFLHISSAFPRKGVDVLLDAYFSAFTAADDVCLVLKTFPNVHNKTVEQLMRLRKKYPNGPEVEHIDADLSEDALYGLYKAATCYVHCARGEGFGLPVAEAMLARVPTIVCNNTGLADFSREDTCITVKYTMVKAHSHLSENSCWAEPDSKDLQRQMRRFAFHPESCDLENMVENAYRLISTRFTWQAVAERWLEFIGDVMDEMVKPSVDMVTTWNTKCGIAEFTRYYVENSNKLVDYRIFPDTGHKLLRKDESFVEERSWHQGMENRDIAQLIAALRRSPSEIVHIQYNLGFFSGYALATLCKELEHEKKVIVLFHATKALKEKVALKDWRYVIDGLNRAFRVVVHQEADAEALHTFGIRSEKIRVIPLGQMVYPARTVESARHVLGIRSNHVIGSYGFLLPHKGVEKTLQAVALLRKTYPDILFIASCALYDAPLSHDYYQACRQTVAKLHLKDNVLLVTDFLDPKESILLLQACDVLAMAYDPTNESASGAVRFCVAAQRPLITTRQEIFREFEDCCYQIDENTPTQIAAAIQKMLDPAFAKTYVGRMAEHIENTSWHTVVRKYLALYGEEC